MISATISSSVTSIGSYAFSSCTGLATVTLGGKVKTIGNYAFVYFSNLKCVYFYGESSPNFGILVFSGVPANTVMTFVIYQNETFSTLEVSKRSTIGEYLPISLIRYNLISVFIIYINFFVMFYNYFILNDDSLLLTQITSNHVNLLA